MKLSALDPFAVFGMPIGFQLDLAALARTHRDLSRASHPDRHVEALPELRRQALTRSLEVSEAYRALRSEITRAEACFRLAGVAVGDGHEPAPTTDLLMEVMSDREELADARAAADSLTARARIAALEARNAMRIAAIVAHFNSVLTPGVTVAALQLELSKLGQLRYFVRLREEVQLAIDDLDGLGER
jgi:molecular chaperone HscB